MYEIGEKRKFEMPNSIFYTGTIVEKVGTQLLIKTERGEDLTINLNSIVQSKRIGADRREGNKEH